MPSELSVTDIKLDLEVPSRGRCQAGLTRTKLSASTSGPRCRPRAAHRNESAARLSPMVRGAGVGYRAFRLAREDAPARHRAVAARCDRRTALNSAVHIRPAASGGEGDLQADNHRDDGGTLGPVWYDGPSAVSGVIRSARHRRLKGEAKGFGALGERTLRLSLKRIQKLPSDPAMVADLMATARSTRS